MKKILLYLNTFLFLPIYFSFAQTIPDKKEEISNIEKISNRTSTLLRTTSIYIGAVEGINIATYRIRDLATADSISGIRLYRQNTTSNKDTESVYIDSDEVSSIINAFSFLINKTATKPPVIETKYIFYSRGGFRLVTITQTNFVGAKTKWAGFVGLDGPLFNLAPENFTTFKDLIVQAKAKM